MGTFGDLPGEIWRPIPLEGWERCYVSTMGRIKKDDGHLLTGTPSNGYISMRIRNNGIVFRESLHRLVATAFHGQHDDLVVNHKDGDKMNNIPKNLEFVTYSQNTIHAYDTGLRPRGKRST